MFKAIHINRRLRMFYSSILCTLNNLKTISNLKYINFKWIKAWRITTRIHTSKMSIILLNRDTKSSYSLKYWCWNLSRKLSKFFVLSLTCDELLQNSQISTFWSEINCMSSALIYYQIKIYLVGNLMLLYVLVWGNVRICMCVREYKEFEHCSSLAMRNMIMFIPQ